MEFYTNLRSAVVILFWLAVGAALGFVYELRFVYWFDVPFKLQYALQVLNGLNLALLLVSRTLLRPGLPPKLKALLRIQEEHAVALCAQGAATFGVVAFYEHFSPTVGFAFALFPLWWLIHVSSAALSS